jgi:hypothetical protein
MRGVSDANNILFHAIGDGNVDPDTEMRHTEKSKPRNQRQTGRPKSIWVIPAKSASVIRERK